MLGKNDRRQGFATVSGMRDAAEDKCLENLNKKKRIYIHRTMHFGSVS